MKGSHCPTQTNEAANLFFQQKRKINKNRGLQLLAEVHDHED
jgi:hypothetical protein